MRPGPLEIVLIIFVIIAVLVIARILGPDRRESQKNRKSGARTNDRSAKFLGRTGIALIIAGGLTLIAGVSMLQWLLHNYVLSIVLIVVGIIVYMISRRRR